MENKSDEIVALVQLITEAVEACVDADLLDLIYKLLIS